MTRFQQERQEVSPLILTGANHEIGPAQRGYFFAAVAGRVVAAPEQPLEKVRPGEINDQRNSHVGHISGQTPVLQNHDVWFFPL
jgi:hypothetical protein